MAITAETRTAIVQLVVTAYDAAPGTTLLTELVTLVDEGGSLADVAANLTTRTEWTSKYPSFQTAGEFGAEWLGALVPEASADALAAGIVTVEGLIAGGSTFADIIIAAQGYLAALPITDATFGTSAGNFANKVTVATYQTITLEEAGAGSLAGVTSDVATVATTNTAAAAAANPVASTTVALTTGLDAIAGDSSNNTITAASGTWATGDTIRGGDGVDTLNATLTGAGPTQSATSLTGVEILNLTASPNPSTLNLTGVTGLTEVNNASSANGATLAVSGLGNGVNTTITGSNAATTIGYSTAVTAATATTDASTLTLAGTSAGSSFTATGIEAVTVKSTTSANVLSSLAVASATSVVLEGDQNLAVLSGTVGGTALKTLNASAATGAITLTTGSGTSAATDITGVTVTGPSSADAGTFTITTGGNKDVVNLGGGDSVVATGAGADTITATAGANTITPGTGNDILTLGAGVDTVRFAEAGATNADSISSFSSTDVIAVNLGSAAVTGSSAANPNGVFGTLQTGGTSPVMSNVGGAGTGTAISFQAITPNATATSGTVLAASNVIALNGAFTDGTATGAINALGTSATTGIATTATGKFLLVTYSVGNIAQVWAFAGDTTLDTNITAAELSLVATLDGIAQNSLTADNFATYFTPAATTTTVSNTGQTIELTGTLNIAQSTANAAGQFLSAANDTINVGTGSLPTGAASATSGLTIIDPSTSDADVMNATNLSATSFSAGGVVMSGIETVNLNMLVTNTTFSAAAVTPGTSQFGLTGTQNFVTTSLPVGGGVTLGSGFTGTATFGVISDTAATDSIVVNLAGSTATSATVGANVAYVELTADSMEAATVNVSAASSIRMSGADLFAAASDITATTLAGSGSVTIFGTAAALGTLNLNGDGLGYTGALTLRPTTNAAMDFSIAGAGGLVTGIDVINLSSVASGTFASTITLDSANSAAGAATTVSYAPLAAGTLGAWGIAQEGSGLSDTINLSMGSLATTTGAITATSIESFIVTSSRTTGVTLGNITLTDGVGTQTVTVRAAAVGAGTITADSVDFSGVVSTVTGVTLANTAGATFQGGAGNTTVAGSAAADVINTSIGNDVITGLAGNDIINASSGTNSITGGTGVDTMAGGSGVDTYIFAAGDSGGPNGAAVADVITGFTAGTDKLQFAGVVDIISVQQGAVQTAVTALGAGATDAAIATAMALANTTVLGVSFAVANGATYVYYEGSGTTTTDYVTALDVFVQLVGVTTAPTFAADVIA